MGYQVCRGVTFEDVDGTMVGMDLRGDVAVLNGTASEIVSRLLAGEERAAVVASIAQRHRVCADLVLGDVGAVIDQLKCRGFVEESV